MCTCVSWATRGHKNGAPLDEVEVGAINNVHLRDLGHSLPQEWSPAG